ncbi:MAG: DUF4830 domain-containing protein [Clostridia bacterium]|nr:DUF4830 domain-containing protein [Clostridia bacterium]
MFAVVTSGKKIYKVFTVCLLVAVLICSIAFTVNNSAKAEEDFPKGATHNERINFLSKMGYSADIKNEEQKSEIFIPAEFSSVYNNYNSLQKSAGYDLLPFAGKKATLYSVKLEDKTRDDLYAHIIVYEGNIIGGDISALSVDDGFMLPLKNGE